MNQISIPPRFYLDHAERDLPAPPILSHMRGGYVIDADHPDFTELVDDAKHYADPLGPDAAPPQVVSSAKALLRAVKRQMVRV